MKKVKIVGVPEHFNFPWKLSIAQGEFRQYGIDLQWEDVPEGTGRICEMLRNEIADFAVVLTEGICKDIAKGASVLIVQKYIQTPLLWGIHVASESPYTKVQDLENKKVAVSRLGSGSHLMAMVHAKQMGWPIEKMKFVPVDTFQGAVSALQSGVADYFLWEQFMTQPIVDANIFRRLGVCPTPWSAFVLAVRADFYNENKALVERVLQIINQTTLEFKQIPAIDTTLSVSFDQKIEHIREWLSLTKWSQKKFTEKEFEQLNQLLMQWAILEKPLLFHEVITN